MSCGRVGAAQVLLRTVITSARAIRQKYTTKKVDLHWQDDGLERVSLAASW